MTEADWAASKDPVAMVTFLKRHGGVSERKFRLFSVACCRVIEHRTRRHASRTAVDVAERYADGKADEAEVAAAWQAVTSLTWPAPGDLVRQFFERRYARAAASYVLIRPTSPERVVEQALLAQSADARGADAGLHCNVLRDVVGPHPFHLVTFEPEWRTSTVLAIAKGMYETRDFSVMPILADALQDAGCEDENILSHCRGSCPHVRGCWVVDLILGKE